MVNESSNDTSEIAEADVHRDADAPFEAAADVVAVPCHAERDEWIDAYWSRELACLPPSTLQG